MKLIISNKKGLFFFSIFKYFEIFVTALTTFFLAKKIGPNELGESISIFLYITYANYLSLGVNQTIVKNLSRTNESDKLLFLTFNVQFLLIISALNIFLALIVLDKYFLFAAFISIFNLFRSYFSSYYRAIYKIYYLNISNITYSITMLIGVLFFVNSLKDYLIVWLFCLFLSVFLYIIFDIGLNWKLFNNLLFKPSKDMIKFTLNEGIKLAATGIIVTIMITSDRFIINQLDLPMDIKGSYQLADYIGMAFYMFFTTIIFYYTPSWIEKIRSNNVFLKRYLENSLKVLLFIPFILILIYVLSLFLVPIFFPEYPNLHTIIIVVVFSKLTVAAISLLSFYYVGMDKEKSFLKLMLMPLLLIGCLFIVYITNLANNYLMIPILNGSIILISAVINFFVLIKKTV